MRKYVCAWLLWCVACSAGGGGSKADPTDGSASGGGPSDFPAGGGGDTTGTGAGTGAAGGGIVVARRDRDAAPDGPIILTTLPSGFVQTEIGGYKLGTPLNGGTGPDAGTSGNGKRCGNVLTGVVRDFKGRAEPGGHPDFEGPLYGNDVTLHLVAAALGADQKPVYASACEEGHASPAPTCPFGPETTTQTNFGEWYRYTATVNEPFIVELWFAPESDGLFTFQSLFFFPLDGSGWGNSGADKQGKSRNFSFTTELHTQFEYKGGETFHFEGDDDVWVFINGHLAVDLGGLHPKESGSVSLDASAIDFGISKGGVYDMDLFHAERHTPESTFRIDTNLSFVNCGKVVPDHLH